MTSKILILANQRSKRLSHKESYEKIRQDSEFVLVKSFNQAIEQLEKQNFSLIILDQDICDAPNHRTRKEAIAELKQKSKNAPTISIGYERMDAIKSLQDGADGFIPIHWLT